MPDPGELRERLLRLPSFARGRLAPHGARPDAHREDAASIARRLAALDVRIVLDTDPEYPPALRALADPPPALFVRGTLPAPERSVAIVGSRAATTYGLEWARRLAADLAGMGVAVVSGFARGIDTAAHRGALEAGGETVAVLAGGLDAPEPAVTRELAERVRARGALVSEIPTGGPSRPGMFVRRNRLIAALSAATVVVEAAERSGALSTAAVATRIGRPLFALPGDVQRETSRGCNALIRSGARLCRDAADVIEALGPPEATDAPDVRLLATLGAEPASTEALSHAAGLAVEETLAGLLRLEWAGFAAPCPGQRWVRVAR